MATHKAGATPNDEIAKLRAVMEGLSFAVSEKSLMSSDWAHLRGRLELLYADSRKLISPWPELCAYRLAHILMRDARQETELRRILELLDEAGELTELGPRPLLLRVAVLHRLNMLRPDKGGPKEIGASLNRAAKIETPHNSPDPDSNAAQVSQNVSANLIEQTAYMLGLPLPHDFVPDPNAHFFDKGGWYVIMRGVALVEMPEPLARAFYSNCVDRFRPDLCFEVQQFKAEARVLGNTVGSGNTAKLIAAVCLQSVMNKPIGEIHKEKEAAGDPEASLGVDLSTARKDLRMAFPDLAQHRKFLIEGSPKRSLLRLAPEITYVGLVQKRLFAV